MKVIWVILIFMVMFNLMTIFTNELGIFQITNTNIDPSLTEEQIEEYKGIAGSESNILLYGALSLEIVGGLAIASIAAFFTKSPVPLAIGAFATFCAAMWTRTYFIFSETDFGIPQIFLTAGTVGMGLLFVATTIEILGGGHNA